MLNTYLSLISCCLGICSVILASRRSILTFAFGFAQVITYTYLCWLQRFYGEMAINAYYFATMVYGVYVWKQRLVVSGDRLVVEPRRLQPFVIALIAVTTLIGSWLAGWGLAAWTDDTQPYLDAFTTVPALIAQVLMILVYREHWFIWLAVDILSIILWIRAGDWFMVTQYAIWCANCIYGIFSWRKTS
jgi:nicotinamide mononucleotide transporter